MFRTGRMKPIYDTIVVNVVVMTDVVIQALEMFSDLRQFELAKEFIGASDQKNVKQLIRKQAEWCRSTNDPRSAAWVMGPFLLLIIYRILPKWNPYKQEIFIFTKSRRIYCWIQRCLGWLGNNSYLFAWNWRRIVFNRHDTRDTRDTNLFSQIDPK